MARYATLTGLVIATLSASAAAQTLPSSGEPADPVQQTCAPGIQPRNAVTASTADTPKALLAFLQVRVACPTQPTATSIDGYTRLTVVFQPSDPPNGSERDYKDGQNLLVRYLRGRSISRVLSVKADVLDTKLQGTVPLIAVSHASNKTEGETWSTAMTSRQWLTPYFRINPATGVALEVSLAASTSYQSSAAGNVLDLLGRATKLIAPSSTLVTSLNQERFKDASQFVDQTLNSLFQESITERVPNQFSAAALNGGPLISIDVSFPIKGDITAKSPKPEDKPVLIGRWIVYAEQPMLSVFSALPMPAGGVSGASAAGGCETLRTDLQEACRAFRYVSPAAILNYTVGADTNLAQTLASDAGITAARDKLVQIPPREEQQIKDAAGNLCALIATKVQQIGFSRFDTSAVLWAYGTQAFVGGTAAREMRNAATCPALEAGYAVGLKDRTY